MLIIAGPNYNSDFIRVYSESIHISTVTYRYFPAIDNVIQVPYMSNLPRTVCAQKGYVAIDTKLMSTPQSTTSGQHL